MKTFRRGAARAAAALSALLALTGAARAQQWAGPDSGGNIGTTNGGAVGIGSTAFDPWGTIFKVVAVGPSSGFTIAAGGASGYGFHFTDRAYHDGSSWRYGAASTPASNFYLGSGLFGVRVAPGGAQGAPLTWRTALFVNNTGNVGVGTASPSYRLHVAGDNTAAGGYPVIKLQDTEAGGHSWWLYSGAVAAGSLGVYDETAGTYRMFFDPAGNTGFGTTSPAARLDVSSVAAGGAENFPLIVANRNTAAGARTGILFQDNAQAAAYGAFIRVANNGVDGGGDMELGSAVNNVYTTRLFVRASDGFFGVGVTNPAYRLDVAGSVNASGLCLGGACKSSWAEVGGGPWAGGAGSSISYSAGSVGVGTANPTQLLDVSGAGEVKARAAGTVSAAIQLQESSGTSTWSEWQQHSDRLRLNTSDGTTVRGDVLSILPNGNVGLGEPAPAARLHVNGDGRVTGDLVVDGNISAKFQDVAEWVPSAQKLSAGTVVVLDAGRTNHVVASSGAYDTKVAGVVSAEPGVILGVPGEGKVKVATTGRVKVRVDASRGAVRVGDLLVTSETEGVAMRSVPVDLGGVQIHRPGTIIGKALEPLEKGTGEILVLLSLQ